MLPRPRDGVRASVVDTVGAACCSSGPPGGEARTRWWAGGAVRRCAIVLVHAAGLATSARVRGTARLLVGAPPCRRAAPHSLSDAVVAWRLSSSSCPLHSLASFVRFARHDELTTLERQCDPTPTQREIVLVLSLSLLRFSPRGWTRLPFVRQCREGLVWLVSGSFALG